MDIEGYSFEVDTAEHRLTLVSENEDCVRLASPWSLLVLSSKNEQGIAFAKRYDIIYFVMRRKKASLQASWSYKIANCIGARTDILDKENG